MNRPNHCRRNNKARLYFNWQLRNSDSKNNAYTDKCGLKEKQKEMEGKENYKRQRFRKEKGAIINKKENSDSLSDNWMENERLKMDTQPEV